MAAFAWTQPGRSVSSRKSLLDVAAVDLVKGTAKPVAGILVHGTAVARDGAFPAPGCDGNPVPEGLAQGRDGTGARTSREGGLAQGDAAEDLPGAQRPADHLRQPSRARRHGHRLPHPAPALRQVGRRPPGRAAGEVAARDPDQRRPPLPHPAHPRADGQARGLPGPGPPDRRPGPRPRQADAADHQPARRLAARADRQTATRGRMVIENAIADAIDFFHMDASRPWCR